MKLRFALPCLLLTLAQLAPADQWAGPVERQVLSPSARYRVRMIPGKSIGDTFGFAGAPKGPYATAELAIHRGTGNYEVIRTFTLLNPVAPVDMVLSDGGNLLTFDNWHNMGYGKVAVLYGTDGAVIRAYTLQELFSAAESSQFTQSVSSIWWRESKSPLKLLSGQRNICIDTTIKSRTVEFNLETGAFSLPPDGKCVPLK